MTPGVVALGVLAVVGWGVVVAQAVSGWLARREMRRRWQRPCPVPPLSAEDRQQARDRALRAIAGGRSQYP